MKQMAGIVFRFQNESNFYGVWASASSGAFQCSRVVNGELKPPLGPHVAVAAGVWHDLFVQCEGNRILCKLDGTNEIKLADDTYSGGPGKIGFWTESDSVSYFVDTRVSYAAHEMLAQQLVHDALEAYPRVLGLAIYAAQSGDNVPKVIASKDSKQIGAAGTGPEQEAITQGKSTVTKERDSVRVILPLRDRNGDPIAALAVVMKTFPGQTADNAFARARPILKKMQGQVQSRQDLLQ